MRIGLDFDNTIARYDRLFLRLGRQLGWLAAEAGPDSKTAIRDTVRRLEDGERKWMRLQALAYGAAMADAELSDGVAGFVTERRHRGDDVFIVSHKTRFAAADPNGADLRRAALAWMERHHFFTPDGLGFAPSHVYFEDSRTAKCQRIAELGCDVFVDDLPEVFDDPAFPPQTRPLLFRPQDGPQPPPALSLRVTVATSWAAIAADLARAFDHD